MKIAIDYDGTYSEDPALWDGVIELVTQAGHEARVVTARDDRLDRTAALVSVEKKHPVIYTRGMGKRWFLERFGDGFVPTNWADDIPESILENSKTSPADLAKWRAERGEGPTIPRRCACGGSCAC